MLEPVIRRIPLIDSLNFLKGEETSLRALLLRGAAGTSAIQVFNIVLVWIISIMLARLLGASGYGTYTYAMSWTQLIAVLASLGLGKVIIRNVAAYNKQNEWGLIRGILRYSSLIMSIASLTFLLIAGGIAWFVFCENEPMICYSICLSLLLLPLWALTGLYGDAQKGFQHIVIGLAPSMIVRPLIFITLIISVFLTVNFNLSAPFVISLNVIAAGVTLVIAIIFFKRTLPKEVKAAKPSYDSRSWIYSALPLLVLSGISIINSRTDVLMLGSIKGTEVVGIYQVASRGAGLILFGLGAVNVSLGPIIARLYASDEAERMKRIITQSARFALFISLPIALLMIFAGNSFLRIFGPDFVDGQTALVILSAGQLINVAAGSVGVILVMTGHERVTTVGIGVSAIMNIILNAILIPKWGVEGAATATATSIVLWNVILILYVWKRLKINPTAFRTI